MSGPTAATTEPGLYRARWHRCLPSAWRMAENRHPSSVGVGKKGEVGRRSRGYVWSADGVAGASEIRVGCVRLGTEAAEVEQLGFLESLIEGVLAIIALLVGCHVARLEVEELGRASTDVVEKVDALRAQVDLDALP